MKILLTKILNPKFLDFWSSDFSKNFRELTGGQSSTDQKNLRKISPLKKFQGQILSNLVGGPQSQGVAKFQKVLRWIDRGSGAIFNGEKILALR